jgi:hypothetical protein
MRLLACTASARLSHGHVMSNGTAIASLQNKTEAELQALHERLMERRAELVRLLDASLARKSAGATSARLGTRAHDARA